MVGGGIWTSKLVINRQHQQKKKKKKNEFVFAIVSTRSIFWEHHPLNMANHLRFVARTVMVQEGNVDAAYKTLTRFNYELYFIILCLVFSF